MSTVVWQCAVVWEQDTHVPVVQEMLKRVCRPSQVKKSMSLNENQQAIVHL